MALSESIQLSVCLNERFWDNNQFMQVGVNLNLLTVSWDLFKMFLIPHEIEWE